jgi:hypothetical protein
MESMADNVPVVGHIKSGVHMAMGDEEKAREVAISKYQLVSTFQFVVSKMPLVKCHQYQ